MPKIAARLSLPAITRALSTCGRGSSTTEVVKDSHLSSKSETSISSSSARLWMRPESIVPTMMAFEEVEFEASSSHVRRRLFCPVICSRSFTKASAAMRTPIGSSSEMMTSALVISTAEALPLENVTRGSSSSAAH
jgi:hypothetical protein